MKFLLPLGIVLALTLPVAAGAESEMVPVGPLSADVSLALGLPRGARVFLTGGTVPALRNRDGATTLERFGDTETQARGVLEKISALLAAEGLSLGDVVQLRAYLAPDHGQGGATDFRGWFKVYREHFNNPQNPARPVRLSIGVHTLAHPDWLIEIEAVALYPSASQESVPARSP